MIKILTWVYRWLAKSARTLDITGSDKNVVDGETSVKDIYIGQTVLTALAIAGIATIFYLILNGADLAAVALILLLFFGFYFLWQKGEKITVTIDKTLKAEPERKLIATWVIPGYSDRSFVVDNADALVNGAYDGSIVRGVDFNGTVEGSVLYLEGITIEVPEADIEVVAKMAEVSGTISAATTIPEYVSEACLKMADEAMESLKENR